MGNLPNIQRLEPVRPGSRKRLVLGIVLIAIIAVVVLVFVVYSLIANRRTMSLAEAESQVDEIVRQLESNLPEQAVLGDDARNPTSTLRGCDMADGMFNGNRKPNGKMRTVDYRRIQPYAGINREQLFASMDSYWTTQGFARKGPTSPTLLQLRNEHGFVLEFVTLDAEKDGVGVIITSPCVWRDGTKGSADYNV